mgnify:CR=1 FL=1
MVGKLFHSSNSELKDNSIVIQGFGNVGGAAAYYAALMGFKVVGIIDRTGGLINKDGFSVKELSDLLLARDGNALAAPNLIPYEEMEFLDEVQSILQQEH